MNVDEIIIRNITDDDISIEDFKSVAPLLKPTQISEISKEINIFEFYIKERKEIHDLYKISGFENAIQSNTI